jgi:hypothetical protein
MNKTMKNVMLTESSDVGPTDGYWVVPKGGFVWDTSLREVQRPGDYNLWLRPVSDRGLRYPVLRNRQLLRDFVKLGRDVTQESILEFANRWGWLGVPTEVGMLWDSAPEFIRRDAVATWESGGKSGPLINAEPLTLWGNEARRFAMLWEIWTAVQEGSRRGRDRAKARRDALQVLGDRVQWVSPNRVEITIGNMAADSTFYSRAPIAHSVREGDVADTLLRRWRKGDVVEPARYYVHTEVNRGLAGNVNMAIQPYRTGGMGWSGRISFFPATLLAALHMHLAFELGGIKGEERRCANPTCPNNGGIFFPSRSDQRACDKRCREMANYYRRKARQGGPR